MANFLEERLPIDVRMGASYADDYNVEITQTNGGSEYRHLVHQYPRRTFIVRYTLTTLDLWARTIALYHRAYGMYAGFRVKCVDDFSTNANTGTPTAFDQPLLRLSAGVYQLQKQYGAGATPLGIGLPIRTLFKPVSGTVKVAIGALQVLNTPVVNWAVSTTTGQVTFAANKGQALTGITKAAQAVVTVGSHAYAPGEYAYLSGVSGMTEINGKRGLITAVGGSTITVAINSTGFTTYTSGGRIDTQPQSGEALTAGCEFDIPCRFNSGLDVQQIASGVRETGEIDIVELLNP